MGVCGGFVWLLSVSGVCGCIVCCCLGLLLLLIVILLGCRCWGYLRSCLPVYGLVLCVLRFMVSVAWAVCGWLLLVVDVCLLDALFASFVVVWLGWLDLC